MLLLECGHRFCKKCLPAFTENFVQNLWKRMDLFRCPLDRKRIQVQSLRNYLSRQEYFLLFRKEQVERNCGHIPLFCLTQECPFVISENQLYCRECKKCYKIENYELQEISEAKKIVKLMKKEQYQEQTNQKKEQEEEEKKGEEEEDHQRERTRLERERKLEEERKREFNCKDLFWNLCNIDIGTRYPFYVSSLQLFLVKFESKPLKLLLCLLLLPLAPIFPLPTFLIPFAFLPIACNEVFKAPFEEYFSFTCVFKVLCFIPFLIFFIVYSFILLLFAFPIYGCCSTILVFFYSFDVLFLIILLIYTIAKLITQMIGCL